MANTDEATDAVDLEINGIAHIFLTAGNFDVSREFYAQLLPRFGMKAVIDIPEFYYCVGGRTAFGIRAPTEEHAGKAADQGHPGLHHVCFRMRSREQVDALHDFVADLGVKIVHAPQEDGFAPGYYSVLFEDPDGSRLEANHVPGRGLLEKA